MKRKRRGEKRAKPAYRPLYAGVSAKTAGLPPASPVYLGSREPTESVLSLFRYDAEDWSLSCPATTDELLGLLEPGRVHWINVNGLTGGALERLCAGLGVHPLVVEDLLNARHRPKVELSEDYIFLIVKLLSLREDGSVEYEHAGMILKGNVLLTVQETPGDCFGPVRERIRRAESRLRAKGADYLAYALLDLVVDDYYLVIEKIGDRLTEFELEAAERAGDRGFMPGLQAVKGELLRLRKTIWPVRETLSALVRLAGTQLGADLDPFLRDLHENAVQALETVETYREQAASIHDVYLSSVSNRMNEIMKVLTIISTIFIPLTFLAGVYGMNFRHMPELEKAWAYPALLGVMLLISGGMLLFFKRKKWI